MLFTMCDYALAAVCLEQQAGMLVGGTISGILGGYRKSGKLLEQILVIQRHVHAGTDGREEKTGR